MPDYVHVLMHTGIDKPKHIPCIIIVVYYKDYYIFLAVRQS